MHLTHQDPAIERLLAQVGKALGGDFSDKPAIGEDEGPVAELAIGIRFLLDDLERAHEQRAHEVERLRQIDDVKTRFVHTAAHELGTPLTPVLIQLFMLGRAGPLNEAQQRCVSVMQRNVERVNRLVAQMLDVSRLEGGDLRMELERMDLTPVVADVVESFADVAAQRAMRLAARIGTHLHTHGDPHRLYQVVQNLVSNAIKYAPEGSEVRVSARADEDRLELVVEDDGPGMTAEQMSRLFQPFSRIHDHADGTGLGLYITKGIVEQHGGVMGCSSDGPGRGMRFWALLPAA